jgi:hypothetical protein
MVNAGTHAIVTHLGVGDGIVQSGLVIALLERYERVAFPAYPRHVETMRSIFVNHERVSVYSVARNTGEDYGSPRDSTYMRAINEARLDTSKQIRLGIYSGRGIGWDFSKSFYEHAGIDYAARWQLCPIADAWQHVKQFDMPPPYMVNGARRIFLHDDSTRGFVITRKYVSKGFVLSPLRDIERSILRYASFIIASDEVHCIDSAFFWLTDSLPVKGRLFLHKYPRWQRPHEFKYETFRHWNYIE